VKVRRVLAPVGYRVPIRTIVSAMVLAGVRWDAETALMRSIEQHFGVRRAIGVSSGKAALALILMALKRLTGRNKVVIPAYTCYSVPSAIVKAGLEVVPVDLAPDGFDYDYDQLRKKVDGDVLCVLSIHLFGIPADTERVKKMCEGTGIFVVEDAAQAMGGSVGGKRLGTIGDVGFFSLGRGKNMTCGAGGIILTGNSEISTALDALVASLPAASPVATAASFVTLLALSLLLMPTMYWFPAGLPFLRLGETIFHEDFPIRRLSAFQVLLLRHWRRDLGELDSIRRATAAHYRAHVVSARRSSEQIAYLRYPVILSVPAHKHVLLVAQDGASLGISAMYPTSVGAIPQLSGHLREYDFPRAERIAQSLVTLPTHPLVSDKDRQRICALVNAVETSAPDSALGERLQTSCGGV